LGKGWGISLKKLEAGLGGFSGFKDCVGKAEGIILKILSIPIILLLATIFTIAYYHLFRLKAVKSLLRREYIWIWVDCV
jgi:hypothetical protein